jgi:GAF domain-containing protein
MSSASGPPTETRQAATSAGRRPQPGLARDLSELARALQADSDAGSALRRISAAALTEISNATAAGITIVERGRYRTEGATSDVLERIDRVQYQENDGPCVNSLREEITVRSDDLAAETRWPKYAAAAIEAGFGSLMSFQLFVQSDSIGALNVYARDPNAFIDSDEDAGLLLAAHAAVAISGKRAEANLRTALESRDIIGQAKGILMERLKLNADQAFQVLVAVSQHQHRKLRDVADDLAATGDLPDFP